VIRLLAFLLIALHLLAVSSQTVGASCIARALKTVRQEILPLKEDERVRDAITTQLKQMAGRSIRGDFGKMLLYPVFGPFSLIAEAKATLSEGGLKSVWKVPFRFIRKDGAVIVGAFTIGYVMGRFSIDQTDFDEQTVDFEDQLGRRPYVYVDFIGDDDNLSGVPEFYFKNHPAHYPKTHFIRAKNFSDAIQQIHEIERTDGPIYGLQFFGHGVPGEIAHGDEDLTPELNELSRAGQRLALAPGGKIKLNSCTLGLGDKGDAFIHKLGRVFLPQGGDIYSARVAINSNAADLMRKQGHSVIADLVSGGSWIVNYSLLGIGTPIIQGVNAGAAGGGELGIVHRVRTTHIDPTGQ
jgi:hypothetical protein